MHQSYQINCIQSVNCTDANHGAIGLCSGITKRAAWIHFPFTSLECYVRDKLNNEGVERTEREWTVFTLYSPRDSAPLKRSSTLQQAILRKWWAKDKMMTNPVRGLVLREEQCPLGNPIIQPENAFLLLESQYLRSETSCKWTWHTLHWDCCACLLAAMPFLDIVICRGWFLHFTLSYKSNIFIVFLFHRALEQNLAFHFRYYLQRGQAVQRILHIPR
jgi:hypothetical protein